MSFWEGEKREVFSSQRPGAAPSQVSIPSLRVALGVRPRCACWFCGPCLCSWCPLPIQAGWGERPAATPGALPLVRDLISAYLCTSFTLGDQTLTGVETLAQGCTAGVWTRFCSSPGLLIPRPSTLVSESAASLPTYEICDLESPRIHFLLQKTREIPVHSS